MEREGRGIISNYYYYRAPFDMPEDGLVELWWQTWWWEWVEVAAEMWKLTVLFVNAAHITLSYFDEVLL